jgi:sterol desaturase/sphingolipid hydroxylase (fatty acid hydroxylase superfamily)
MAKLFVTNKDESARIFKSNILEAFTKVHWSVPLWVYVPVSVYFLYRSYFMLDLRIEVIGLMFVAGALFWTFAEYILHRFLFHYHPTTELGKRISFMFHGVHHDYPNDSLRLVMPPSVSLPLAALFYLIFRFALGYGLAAPFMSGFLVGYLFYDITHYALHHFGIRKKFWLDLKQHHMKHHYQNPDAGFGVSQSFWDLVFGTGYPKEK